jgi:hypothetical protein
MLFVEGLTRGLPGGRQNRGVHRLGGARVSDRPSGKTPYNLNTAIDPLRFDGARLRGLHHTGLVAFMGRLFWQGWQWRYLNARENVLRTHRPRTRPGVLDHLQQPARNNPICPWR